jgi:branched-chain amino acid transport system substrate-binding protein
MPRIISRSSFPTFLTYALLLAGGLWSTQCSTTFEARGCKVDGDCGAQLLCIEPANAKAFCGPVSLAPPLRIGMSAAVTGKSSDLGTEMRRGIQLAFDEANEQGVRGRKLELVFRDDSYDAAQAENAAKVLLDVQKNDGTPARCPSTSKDVVTGLPDTAVSNAQLTKGPGGVLAMIGNVGTPTMVRAAPITVETQSIFFGAFTGAGRMLRDETAGPCKRFIFNLRASYGQEARATLEFFFNQSKTFDDRFLLSFDQKDSFGQAGYDGLVKAYKDIKATFTAPKSEAEPIARFRYVKDDENSPPEQAVLVQAYLAGLLRAQTGPITVGILMTDTYGPAAKFITLLKNWQYATDAEQTELKKADRLTLLFSNVSFVGPNTLALRLKDAGTVPSATGPKPYTENVYVSQVVPNYQTETSDTILRYRKRLEGTSAQPTFTSLEGYLAGRVFTAGLAAHKGPYTSEALVETFEKLTPLGLGLGASEGFSATNHQYSKSVYGTGIAPDGSFRNRYFWSDGSPVQIFE